MVLVPNNVRVVAVIVTSFLSICVAAPLVIFFLKGYIKLSESVMIRKRHPKILRFIAIGMVIWLMIGVPIMTTDWAELDQIQGINKEILRRVNATFYPWFTHGLFLATTWRFWHIYFDLKHSSTQKNSEWKYHLDPNLVQHNFWLTHKKDYG
eukprot:423188_1